MLNHTYTSVKNANLVDCGKKQHIPSQQFPLLRDNFLGEFRTELDKKKVLANLGIVTELSLEWEFIKGDIGKSTALMQELDSRTTYVSKIDGFKKTLIDGIKALEDIIGGELDVETEQDKRITDLESNHMALRTSLEDVQNYISDTVDININQLDEKLQKVTSDLSELSTKLDNITSLIQVSTKENNALQLIEDSETPGLYVPDLSESLNKASEDITQLQEDLAGVNTKLDTFVTKEDLGGEGDYNFVKQTEFDSYTQTTNSELNNIKTDLQNTVKTGEDGHVDTLYVNTISKDNDEGNIKITDSFEVESGIPLDVRFVVKTLEELYSLNPKVCYAGMGVIVSDQASLYILREPFDGIITEEFIQNSINWRCPDDLVIEVLTTEEYNQKLEEGTLNPHMFYYVQESDDPEPTRANYPDEESYLEAVERWKRTIRDHYMSASWGNEIEKLVANKATTSSVDALSHEITNVKTLVNSIIGGSSGIDLSGLDTRISENTSNIEELTKESGPISTLQTDLQTLQTTVESDYVTKDSIMIDDPATQYIFVKNSEFEAYKNTHEQAISEKIATKEVEATSVNSKTLNTEEIISKEIVLNDNTLTSTDDNLMFNEEPVALVEQIPVIEVIADEDFKVKEDIDPDTYYYVYDTTERHVLDSEFTEYKTNQNNAMTTLSNLIVSTQDAVGSLADLTTTNNNSLVLAINELVAKIASISSDLESLKNSITNSETI